MSLKPLITCVVVFVLALVSPLGPRVANAVRLLQIYLEGGTYNTTTESWELTPPGSSGGEPFRLWTIGNVAAKGTISDVRLAVSYSAEFSESLQVTLTPTRIGGEDVGEFTFGGVTILDPSTPLAVFSYGPVVLPSAPGTLGATKLVNTTEGLVDTSPSGVVANWSAPVLSDGKPLPEHGIYGVGTVWKEFYLGDFDKTDSGVGDFIGSFPTSLPTTGQINAYDVSVTGGSGSTVHFDLYNHIQSPDKATFCPFSHDGDGDVNVIPEPSSLIVWSLFCALGIAVQRWRRRKVA